MRLCVLIVIVWSPWQARPPVCRVSVLVPSVLLSLCAFLRVMFVFLDKMSHP